MDEEETRRSRRNVPRGERPTAHQVNVARLSERDRLTRRIENLRNNWTGNEENIQAQQRRLRLLDASKRRLEELNEEIVEQTTTVIRTDDVVTGFASEPSPVEEITYEPIVMITEEQLLSCAETIERNREEVHDEIGSFWKRTIKKFRKKIWGDYTCMECGKETGKALDIFCNECQSFI